MTRKENKDATFYGLGIAPSLLDKLAEIGFKHPTPIQQQAIPIGMTGDDLIGIAQTGTGKTLAFTLPMLQRLSATKGQALILAPTRELALQIEETVIKLGKSFGVKTAVVIGGANMDQQRKKLRGKPHVIIATPGRLIDHIQKKSVNLRNIKVVVLDEADRMLDMGFAPQINKILAVVPKDRQTMLFSATMPAAIAKIAAKYMKKPLRVEVAPSGTTVERVQQELFIVPKQDKIRLLERLLSEYRGTVLVFSRTKHGAKKIARQVRGMKHSAAEIHGNRSLPQRKDALSGFKSGKYRVLVATDIAARGIDVDNVELVINYDLPDQKEDYVHRIGRTARAGREGKAISFASPEQGRDVDAIERLIRDRLPIMPLPELPERTAPIREPRRPSRHQGQRGQRSGQKRGSQTRPKRSSQSRPKHGSQSSSKSGSHPKSKHGSQPQSKSGSQSRSKGGSQSKSRRPKRKPRKFTSTF